MPSTERVAFLDTSVLYPVSLLDLGLRLAERDIHDILWTEDLLTELERVWDRDRSAGRRVPSAGAAVAAFDGIRRTFPDCEVPRASYEALIDQMPGSDAADKPHCAAAVTGGATHIVTADTSGGFPPAELSTRGVAVAHPDDYYTDVAREYPDDIRAVIHDMAAQRAARHPGFGVDDLLARFDSFLSQPHRSASPLDLVHRSSTGQTADCGMPGQDRNDVLLHHSSDNPERCLATRRRHDVLLALS